MVDIVTNSDSGFDPWFARELVCPRDKSDLRRDGERLVCRQLHTYPIIDDIPIMLVDDVPQTLPDLTQRSFGAIAAGCRDGRNQWRHRCRSCKKPSSAPTATSTAKSRGDFRAIRYQKCGCRPRGTAHAICSISDATGDGGQSLPRGAAIGRSEWIPVSNRFVRRGESRGNSGSRRAFWSATRATFRFAKGDSTSSTRMACCNIFRLTMRSSRSRKQPESSRRAAPY